MKSSLLSETVDYPRLTYTELIGFKTCTVLKNCRSWLRFPSFSCRQIFITCLIMIAVLVFMKFVSQMKVPLWYHDSGSETFYKMSVVPPSFSTPRHAFCLDGSPPAFYTRKRPNPANNFWIIYIPGGAWCSGEEQCFNRSLTDLGSSHAASPSLYLDGFLSANCDKNPDFCDWNVAVLHYCDGGSFLGNVSSVLSYKSQPLYLRGARIFDTLIEYLLLKTNLSQAEKLVLAGSSAGGIAALIHADRLHSRLPKSVKTVHVIVDGAMFVDTPSINGSNVTAQVFQSVFKLHSLKDSSIIQECIQKQSAQQEWRCLLPEVYHNFVKTPTFFINSVYDTWQRTNFLEIPCFTVICPQAYLTTVYALRNGIQNLAGNISQSKKNNVFLTGCPLHVILIRSWFFEQELGNPTLQSSVTSWLKDEKVQKVFYKALDMVSSLEQCSSMTNYLLKATVRGRSK